MARRLTLWGPVAAWMALIFVVSAQPSLPRVAPEGWEVLVTLGSHFLEYAVLGALLGRATSGSSGAGGLLLPWGGATLYGVTDEFHQLFVQGRTASPEDLVADAVGALFGLWLYRRWLGSAWLSG